MCNFFRLVFLIALPFVAAVGLAVEPDEVLSDPALETRAREISKGLRCLQCQNQSIDDSNADIARDLRLVVRERLVAGDSDDQVIEYVVDRYGEFILLRPVFALHTLVLWLLAPFLLVLGAIILFIKRQQTRRVQQPQGLTDKERADIEALTLQFKDKQHDTDPKT